MTPRVVYIAGTGRSGSTALARYLEPRLRAVHLGEVRYLWTRGVDENHLCECTRPFAECEFWTAVTRRAFGDDLSLVRARVRETSGHVDRMRHVPALMAGHRFAPSARVSRFADCVAPLYDAAADLAGGATLIDSSKDPSYLFALGATGRVDLSVVHLVRDSRAVAYSWTQQKLRPEIHWRAQHMSTRPTWRSAALWLEYNLAIDLYRTVNPRVVRVRYEDFAAAPDEVVPAALAQIGLDCDRAGSAPDGSGHSFSGNPMRFETGPLRIRRDDAWLDGLPAADRAGVSAMTAPLLLRYGYQPW